MDEIKKESTFESTPVGTGSVVGRIENVTSEIEK